MNDIIMESIIKNGIWLTDWLDTDGYNGVKRVIDGIFSETNQDTKGAKYFFVPLLPFSKDDLFIREMVKSVSDKVEKGRRQNFAVPAVFVVLPPFYDVLQAHCHLLVKARPKNYGDNTQAFFCAELMREDGDNGDFVNILTFADLMAPDGEGKERVGRLERFIDRYLGDDTETVGGYLEKFYNTYVDFYDTCVDDKISKIDNTTKRKVIKCLDNNDCNDLMFTCDVIHRVVHGVEVGNHHSVSKEIFRSPIPFLFWEFIAIRKKVVDAIGGGDKKLRLWLIDNNPKDKLDGVREALNNEKIFETEAMVKNTQGVIECRSSLEGFYPLKFPAPDSPRSDDDKDKVMASLIRNRDDKHQPHFILLDFFLNGDDNATDGRRPSSYFALDFIKDFGAYKRQNNDHSTTWYFIASAVHDSVTRYSQSGLLAEYYESAVVNAGDDPTNKKRQIIFLYKLLTFVNARIKSVLHHYELVVDRFFKKGEGAGSSCQLCCTHHPEAKDTRQTCFNDVRRSIGRFLAEDEDFAGMLVKDYGNMEDIFRLLRDTINKFEVLPQADWPIIQHQIDFIRSKLTGCGEGLDFHCQYINHEIRQRSDRY